MYCWHGSVHKNTSVAIALYLTLPIVSSIERSLLSLSALCDGYPPAKSDRCA
ncbi:MULTISPECIES: hypothetical protein [unclassified Nostoc]|uniref:hypothetical protein n=1 Tax=unclassified Nostoc TaxID=2593658 RepID=UPI0025AA4B7C|nr:MULTISPECIES: hypothetical protein [unclassified Nostoc]MDM9581961.1 hypothetical protein [Nostoc sp. GT001]MDZ7995677.1 hypothetical protein [Nostoc sp. EspVER01]